jgi:hypothetical protein
MKPDSSPREPFFYGFSEESPRVYGHCFRRAERCPCPAVSQRKKKICQQRNKRQNREKRKERSLEIILPFQGGGASRTSRHKFSVSEIYNSNNLYPPVRFNETILSNPHISVKRYPEKRGIFRVFFMIFFALVKKGGKSGWLVMFVRRLCAACFARSAYFRANPRHPQITRIRIVHY